MSASDDSGASGQPRFSRRLFFKGLGSAAAVTAGVNHLQAAAEELEKLNDEKLQGPGPVKVTLTINGQAHALEIEPRVTLLDVLRNHLGLTGSKEVCDRATCGACTVLLDGTPVYACMTLAIAVQRRKITTIEGLAQGGELTKVQEAFIACDGLMCGYCTPGFVMSVTALLGTNPKPTEAEVRKACSGNLCRCGTYPRVFQAALTAAGVESAAPKTEVITLDHV